MVRSLNVELLSLSTNDAHCKDCKARGKVMVADDTAPSSKR